MDLKKPNEDDLRLIEPAVPREFAGARVDYYLSDQYPFLSRAGWQKKIDAHELLVNQRSVRPAYRVKAGDAISHYKPAAKEPTVDRGVRILWQGGNVLCAFKPSGLPMHEGGEYRKNTFREVLKELTGDAWEPVHRLDRETSGVVLCAGTEFSKADLCRQFAEKRVEKQYLAIATGNPLKEKWTIDTPIENTRDQQIRKKKPISKKMFSAQTEFEVVETKENLVCLRAFPRTGRTNQVRIHAAQSGHPLIGDQVYGRLNPGLPTQQRLCLHAERISFFHPESGVWTHCEAEMPDDMQDIWQDPSLVLGSPLI